MQNLIRLFMLFGMVSLFAMTVRAQQPAAPAGQAVPGVVRFSGTLTNAAGQPLSGTAGVTFALYAYQQGGPALWMETQNVAVDDQGRYTVLLGASSPTGIPSGVFTSNQATWLGVQAQGQDEQPRVLLVSVPYALKAADADTVGGIPASAFVLAQPQGGSSGTGAALVGTGTAQGSTQTAASVSESGQRIISRLSVGGSGTQNYVPKWDAAGVNLLNSRVFDNGTNVGIGTTTPTGTLDVGGWPGIPGDIVGVGSNISGDLFVGNTGANTGRFWQSSNANQGFLAWNMYYNGSGNKAVDTTSPGWFVNIGGGHGIADFFSVQRAAPTAGIQAPVTLFYVSNAGKLGIGTTTPTGTMDAGGWPGIPGDIVGVGSNISGDLFVGNTGANTGRFWQSSNANQGFLAWNMYYNGSGNKAVDATNPGWFVNIGGGNGIADFFSVQRAAPTAGLQAPATLFYVGNNGKVGIGTTTPAQALDVVGNINASGGITAASFSGSGASLTGLNATNISSGTLGAGFGGTGLASCATNQVLQWSGAAWSCGTVSGGGGAGTVTSVGSGTGLTGGPITTSGTLQIDATVVPQLGAANIFTVGPQTIQTGAAANKGLIVKGAASQTGNLQEWQLNTGAPVASLSSAGVFSGNGSLLTSLNATNITSGTLGAGFGGTGLTSCSNNQVLQWSGVAWSCGTVSGGTVTNVATGAGLTGGPITGTGTISVANGGVTNAMLAAGSVTSGDIASGTIVDANINGAAAINPAKISGTAATLGANTFGATQTISSGNLAVSTGGVGVGTAPLFPLDVSAVVGGATHARFGSAFPLYLISNNPIIGFNANWNLGFQYGSTHPAGLIAFNLDIAGGFSFDTAPSGTSGTAATLTPRMTISNAGAVSIGGGAGITNSSNIVQSGASATTTTILSGTAIDAGTCITQGVTVTGATTTMAVVISPQGNPTVNGLAEVLWFASIDSASHVTAMFCKIALGTATATGNQVFSIRVLQ